MARALDTMPRCPFRLTLSTSSIQAVVQVPEFLNELPWAMQERVKKQTAAIEKATKPSMDVRRLNASEQERKKRRTGQMVIFMIEKSSPRSSERLTS
jgi:hypothetical protein